MSAQPAGAGGDAGDRGAVEITEQPNARRYELRVDGQLAGLLDYRVDADEGPVRFTHAEVYPRYEKQGLGTEMVKQALDDVIGRGQKFIPQCPFVASFVDENPSYAEHVA